MQKEFVIIGTLGIWNKGLQLYQFKPYHHFKEYQIAKGKELYLIFSSHRVLLVKVEGFSFIEGKYYMNFDEELDLHQGKNDVSVGLTEEEYVLLAREHEEFYPENMNVIEKDTLIGTVIDWFDGGAHPVLVIKTVEDKEFMIPFVEAYIQEYDTEHNRIIIQDSEELRNL